MKMIAFEFVAVLIVGSLLTFLFMSIGEFKGFIVSLFKKDK